MDGLKQRDTCRLCGSKDIEIVMKLEDSPIADAFVSDKNAPEQIFYPLDLSFCNNCSHVQLINVINPDVLFKEYFYETSTSLGLVEHFERYSDALIETINPAKGSLVIDIGSNDGTLLKFFKASGMNILGIDPAENIVAKANAKGIETIASFFTIKLAKTIKEEYGKASIITANNVFAHADDMDAIATGISTLLAKDGVFVFEVSYLIHIIERILFDTIYHEHLCYHSVKPLSMFFDKHGMELISIEYIQTKGGSLHGVVQLKNGPRKRSPNVAELIKMEHDKGYHTGEIYKKFDRDIEEKKIELLSTLKNIKAKNKSIIGYGSSQTCTTLSYHFQLNAVLDYIVDDNSEKQGLFSPGRHLPILSSDKIYEDFPDYILILAWQYAKPIINKHEKYIMDGGQFIIPLPELLVINKTNIEEWKKN